MVISSSVRPELDSAMNTSCAVTMPRSPWLASAGCTKKAGVPVEASVAAILRAMCPDLPMPLTMTRPWQASTWRQGTAETLVQRLAQVLHGIGLDGQHLAGTVEQGVVVDLGRGLGGHARTGK